MAQKSAIEKLDYVYKHIQSDSSFGDKNTCLNYLQDIAMEIDALVLNDTCDGGKTIPSHNLNV